MFKFGVSKRDMWEMIITKDREIKNLHNELAEAKEWAKYYCGVLEGQSRIECIEIEEVEDNA